jgi:hypothetical protein
MLLFSYRVTRIGPQNAQLICLPPDDTIPHTALVDHSDNKESKATRHKSQETTINFGSYDMCVHKAPCRHKLRSLMQKTSCYSSQQCFKSKPKKHVQILNSAKSKSKRPEVAPESDCSKKPFRQASTDTNNIQECVGRNKCECGLRSPLPTVLTLPMKDIQSAMDYHLKFHRYMKFNPMYKSRTPWIMVRR